LIQHPLFLLQGKSIHMSFGENEESGSCGQPNPGAARNRYVPDTRKAQQQLGLGVTVPLAEAIRRSALP